MLTFEVEPGHPAYDDPEWAADAAWGPLSNEYGPRTIYTDLDEVRPVTDKEAPMDRGLV